jgi:hypothetical protein
VQLSKPRLLLFGHGQTSSHANQPQLREDRSRIHLLHLRPPLSMAVAISVPVLRTVRSIDAQRIAGRPCRAPHHRKRGTFPLFKP